MASNAPGKPPARKAENPNWDFPLFCLPGLLPGPATSGQFVPKFSRAQGLIFARRRM